MFVIVRRGSNPREYLRWLAPDAQGHARWEWYTRRAPAARFITVTEVDETIKALGLKSADINVESISG